MKQIVIIGAGIFGSMLAVKLRRLGYPFTLVDCKQTLRASKAGACLLKREWANGLHPDKQACDLLFDNAMLTIDSLFPNSLKGFTAGAEFTVIRPDRMLAKSREDYALSAQKTNIETFTYDEILKVDTVNGIAYGQKGTYEGILYIANGFWAKTLVPEFAGKMRGLCGTSFIVKSNPAIMPCGLETFAPYKQMIWFPLDAWHSYFSDGTAIKLENYGNEQMLKTLERCREKGFGSRVQFDTGVRPYLNAQDDRTGTYRKLSPNAFLSTGGAKIGTLLAATYANNFCEDNDII